MVDAKFTELNLTLIQLRYTTESRYTHLYLTYVLTDLHERFRPETLDGFKLTIFIPENTIRYNTDELDTTVKSLLNRFGQLLELNTDTACFLLKDELVLWREKWLTEKEQNNHLPVAALELMDKCNKDVFGIIHSFLLILATLPVTNSSAERSFSSLRRLKTYLRFTMSENRLCGLALMHIHRQIPIDVEKVIKRFSKTGSNKKLDLSI